MVKPDKTHTSIKAMKNGINLTSSRERELHKFNEADIAPHSFYTAIMGKELQLTLSIIWLLVAVVCDPIYTETNFKLILGWVGLVFGGICVLLFVIFHGVSTAKLILNWIYDVVTYPVR